MNLKKNILSLLKNLSVPNSFGIKLSLASAISATVVSTAVIVYLPWSIASKRNVTDVVTQANQEAILRTSQEIKRLLDSAGSASHIIQSSVYHNLIDFQEPVERERFFLSLLEANPDFTWVQLGFENGDFLGAERRMNGSLRMHFRDWREEEQATYEQVRTYAQQFKGAKPQEYFGQMEEPFYYSPNRPWYKAAMATPGHQAWQVYVYRSTRMPGVDASVSLTRDGSLVGVAGIGIDLGRLSRFLKDEIKQNQEGEIFILNAENKLLASTDIYEVKPQISALEEAELNELGEVENKLFHYVESVLKSASLDQNFQGNFVPYTDPESGETYYISLSSLDYLGLNWTIGTVTPANYYLKEIHRNRHILFISISGFVLLTAGCAIFLSDKIIAQPVLTVAQAAREIEAQVFNRSRLSRLALRRDEFGQLARVFQKMAEEVHMRERNLKNQVKALKIEIDEVKRQKRVNAIVETEFFQDLTSKAQELRARAKSRK